MGTTTKMSSEADIKMSPEADTKMSPEEDTKMSSEVDTKMSPEADTKMSPEADTKVSPEADTKVSSETETGERSAKRQKLSHECDLSRHLKMGDAVPDVNLKLRVRTGEENVENPFDWKDMKTSELFGDKRVVVFGLPGAFTPTCSTAQVPGYSKLYDELRAQGIDEIYCISVNDAFVMRKWGLCVLGADAEDKTPDSLGFKKLKFLPDGTAAFARAMGMSCMWDSERGFGERSWRYSAVFDNMKIEKIFVEGPMKQNSKEDPFEVSSAENMLVYLKSKNEKREE